MPTLPDADTPPMRYLSLPVTLADADYTAAGQVLLVVLPCGFAMWVPAGEVTASPPPSRPGALSPTAPEPR